MNGMNARGGIRAKARIQQPLEDEADDESEEGADEPEDDEAGSEDDVVSVKNPSNTQLAAKKFLRVSKSIDC